MVRVLPNGEIDDGSSPPSRSASHRAAPALAPAVAGDNSLRAMWTTANTRLLELGLPCLPIGGYVVEPAHLVIAMLALVMFGPMGLIVVAVLVAVSQHDGGNASPPVAAPTPRQPQTTQRPAPGSSSSSQKFFSGSGQRLGS